MKERAITRPPDSFHQNRSLESRRTTFLRVLRHTFVHYIAPQKCKALVAQGGVSLKQPVGYLYLRCSPKHKFLLIDLNTAESVERAPTRTSQSTMTSFGGTAQHLNFFFFFFCPLGTMSSKSIKRAWLTTWFQQYIQSRLKHTNDTLKGHSFSPCHRFLHANELSK